MVILQRVFERLRKFESIDGISIGENGEYVVTLQEENYAEQISKSEVDGSTEGAVVGAAIASDDALNQAGNSNAIKSIVEKLLNEIGRKLKDIDIKKLREQIKGKKNVSIRALLRALWYLKKRILRPLLAHGSSAAYQIVNDIEKNEEYRKNKEYICEKYFSFYREEINGKSHRFFSVQSIISFFNEYQDYVTFINHIISVLNVADNKMNGTTNCGKALEILNAALRNPIVDSAYVELDNQINEYLKNKNLDILDILSNAERISEEDIKSISEKVTESNFPLAKIKRVCEILDNIGVKDIKQYQKIMEKEEVYFSEDAVFALKNEEKTIKNIINRGDERTDSVAKASSLMRDISVIENVLKEYLNQENQEQNQIIGILKEIRAIFATNALSKKLSKEDYGKCVEIISDYNKPEKTVDHVSLNNINKLANSAVNKQLGKVKLWLTIPAIMLLIAVVSIGICSPLIKFNHLGRSFVYSTQSGEFEFRKYDNSGAEIISAVPLSEDGTVEFPSQVALNSEGWFDKDVVAIGAKVFGEESEKNFTAVFIPKSITHIDSNAFDGCNNITLYCEASEKPDGYEDGWSGYNPIIWGVDIEDKIEEVIQADMKFILKEADKTATLMGFDGAGKENLEIPSEVKLDNKSYTVTVISALGENPELKSITAPDSVIKIEKGAFAGCTNLESITLPFVGAELNGTTNTHFGYIFGASGDSENSKCVPDTLSSIIISGGTVAANAFYGCSIDGSVVFEQNVTAIAQSALLECSVKSLTLPFLGENESDISHAFFGYIFGATTYDQNDRYVPESLKLVTITANKIGDYAFANCSSLEKILVSDGIQEIGRNVFEGCSNLKYNIDNIEAKYIDGIKNACLILVDGTNVSGAYTPNANTRIIANNAFESCTELSGITIPQNVVMIGDKAFAGCTGISEMVIPDNVQSIGLGAFAGCNGMTKITIPFVGAELNGTTNTHFGYIFGAESYLENVSHVPERLKDVAIVGDTQVKKYAFYKCDYLTNIKLGESISNIEEMSFYECSGLENISIDEENEKYSNINNCIIDIKTQTLIMGCKNSVIPNDGSVIRIGDGAFSGYTNIESIVIPNKIVSIGDYAFCDCVGLVSILIPNSVRHMGASVFSGCKNITIYCESGGQQEEWNNNWNNIYKTIWYALQDDGIHLIDYCYGDTNVILPSELNGVPVVDFGKIFRYTGITSIVIPASISNISKGAFAGCIDLDYISIMEGNSKYYSSGNCIIETESKTLIAGCGNSVIPDDGSVVRISENAFLDCASLTQIVVPTSITSIGLGAFSGCTSIVSITVPFIGASLNGTEYTYFGYIFGGNRYFENYTHVPVSLENVVISGDVEKIENFAFYNCHNLKSVKFDKITSLTIIGQNAFNGCGKLISINIPDSVISVGYLAFNNCSKLSEVTFGQQSRLMDIMDCAFKNCISLRQMAIPNTLISMGNDAFLGCDNMERISLPFTGAGWGDIVHFGYIFGAPYYSSQGDYIPKSLKEVIITGETSIEQHAFNGCTNLTTVIMLGKVTSIKEYAFFRCSNLTNITISDSVISIKQAAFEGCDEVIQVENGVNYVDKWVVGYDNTVKQVTLRKDTVGIADQAFHTYYSSSDTLTDITVTNNVSVIGYRAFANTKLNNISFEANSQLECIGEKAFYNCRYLNKIVIPESVMRIGKDAFSGCENLIQSENGAKYVDKWAVGYVGSGYTEYLLRNDTVGIADYACKDGGVLLETLPESVKSIGDYAFYNCSIGRVIIPDGVNYIGNHAFERCSQLCEVILPKSATCTIGDYAFANCCLWEIEIPGNIISIGDYAFEGNSFMEGITLSEGISNIGAYAFSGCNMIDITIPNSVVTIGVGAFSNCYDLSSIDIGKNVISIGALAFSNCYDLTSIIIPDSVVKIGSQAFGCEYLTNIMFENVVGWWNYHNIDVNSAVNISEDLLSDTAVAAEYLTHTYYGKYWIRL